MYAFEFQRMHWYGDPSNLLFAFWGTTTEVPHRTIMAEKPFKRYIFNPSLLMCLNFPLIIVVEISHSEGVHSNAATPQGATIKNKKDLGGKKV